MILKELIFKLGAWLQARITSSRHDVAEILKIIFTGSGKFFRKVLKVYCISCAIQAVRHMIASGIEFALHAVLANFVFGTVRDDADFSRSCRKLQGLIAMPLKSHQEFRIRIQNVLWMILVLLCIGLIWRGLGAWLAIVESGYVPGNRVDISALVSAITAYLLGNWRSELLQFVAPVIGLACLLHIGPRTEPVKRWLPSNTQSSFSASDEMAGSAEIIG